VDVGQLATLRMMLSAAAPLYASLEEVRARLRLRLRLRVRLRLRLRLRLRRRP